MLIANANRLFIVERELNVSLKELIKMIIFETSGNKAISFNDETGFPLFKDDNSDMLEEIVGVRVNNEVIEFNTDCDDKSEDGLSPTGWFNPDEYGSYNIHDLFNCLIEIRL